MKKLVLLLGIILYLVSCKVEEPKFANQSTFLEAETTTIEHVSIPLTNSQLLELFRNMSPLAQTRVAVFNLLTEGEVEFWSTEGPGVLVMYFTAPWNGPCKRYRLIFEKLQMIIQIKNVILDVLTSIKQEKILQQNTV